MPEEGSKGLSVPNLEKREAEAAPKGKNTSEAGGGTAFPGRVCDASAELLLQLTGLLSGQRCASAIVSNAAAFLYWRLEQVNWAGFYRLGRFDPVPLSGEKAEHIRKTSEGNRPCPAQQYDLWAFCGKPACSPIPLGKGVIGAAGQSGRMLAVPDVSAFPGHIACDPESQSELVVPLYDGAGRLFALMDLDSPVRGRFDEAAGRALLPLAEAIRESLLQADVRD